MGDHRISIKATVEMHGVKRELDAWWNWSPSGEWNGLDRRLGEWFHEVVDEAMAKYFDAQYDAEMLAKAEQEARERDELERLKAKYESPDQK